jgi:SAM-dependent methyltransferase
VNVYRTDAGPILYGVLDPGHDAGLLFEAVRRGDCLGVGGFLLTENAVTDWPANLRERIGWLLQQLPVVYAADDLSCEWGPHYGVNPLPGEHLDWVADLEQCAILHGGDVRQYATAVQAARSRSAFVLRVFPRDGQADSKPGRPDTYHLLHRFAARYGVPQERIIYGDAKLCDVGSVPTVDPVRVVRAQHEAQAMLDAMIAGKKPKGTVDALDAMLSGVSVERAPSGRRRIALGTVFDPATHYQADYYDGTGVEYMQPDGTWATYHGTGLKWGGNEHVARFIDEIATANQIAGRRMFDFGCSSGDFVGHMLGRGWDVLGYDISQAAIDKAEPNARRSLTSKLTNISPPFDHVTAWDLLEHVWLRDVRGLLEQFFAWLRPGGLLWANICTHGDGEQGFDHQPGITFTKENSWALVAGHVTVHKWWWWRKQMRVAGFRPRDDLAQQWQVRRAEMPGFVGGTSSWSARNFIVMEKPR